MNAIETAKDTIRHMQARPRMFATNSESFLFQMLAITNFLSAITGKITIIDKSLFTNGNRWDIPQDFTDEWASKTAQKMLDCLDCIKAPIG